jgi:hypothetical protein
MGSVVRVPVAVIGNAEPHAEQVRIDARTGIILCYAQTLKNLLKFRPRFSRRQHALLR